MTRSPRAFRPGSCELEGRLLLTKGHASVLPVPPHDTVGFSGDTMEQPPVALQDAGTATVGLYRTATTPPGNPIPPSLRVVVQTDPSDPAVGVNVGAVRSDGHLRRFHSRCLGDDPAPGPRAHTRARWTSP